MQLKNPAAPRGFELKCGKCETRFFRPGLSEKKRLRKRRPLFRQTAAYAVGYESVTQFSKEFKRHFGKPPLSCIKNLKK